jgi:DNA ligase (NAD+)
LICRNENCPEKVKAEILNYFHRSGIEDISDKRIEEMLEKKLITKISDIYSLTKEDFFRLEKVKEKLAEKMFNNIQKSKNQNILNFIVSIGIEGLSKTKTEKIIDHGFNTLEKFLNLSEENLKNIEGFAEKSSRDIVKSLNSKNKLISDLLDAGVRIEELSKKKHSNKLELKKICITGELSRPRSEFEEIIKSHGGVITGSVSKNTDYLLTNETDSGSSKFLKAKSLGVEIISEQELISILGEI